MKQSGCSVLKGVSGKVAHGLCLTQPVRMITLSLNLLKAQYCYLNSVVLSSVHSKIFCTRLVTVTVRTMSK